MRSLPFDNAAILSLRASCHVRRDSLNNTAHAGDALGDWNAAAPTSGLGRDGARMQDGGQDAAVGELDGYAFYGHIQCGVAAAIGVVPPEPLSPIEPQRVPMKIIIFISLAATYSTKHSAT